ncbi:MAG: restriction endonuclease [Phycisphaerales bacterium JB040]
MAVPKFHEFMLPMLSRAKDGQEKRMREEVGPLADHFNLSQEDRSTVLPSGSQTRLYNRVTWACQYLKKAGLLEATGKGKYRITSAGLELLNQSPSGLTLKDLEQYEGYVEFKKDTTPTGETKKDSSPTDDDIGDEQTPEELMQANYETIRASLADELLTTIKSNTPEAFERLVVDLLVAMGYGGSRSDAGQAVGRSGDAGIDGIIKEDKLGLDAVYIQAKRWQNTVGRPDIQAFAGSLEGFRARKGVFITTSAFSSEAHDYVRKIEKKIVLIDGKQLARYMIDFGIGVTETATYTVKAIDTDYFDET